MRRFHKEFGGVVMAANRMFAATDRVLGAIVDLVEEDQKGRFLELMMKNKPKGKDGEV